MVTIYSVIDALPANNNLKANKYAMYAESPGRNFKEYFFGYAVYIIHNLLQSFSTIYNFLNDS